MAELADALDSKSSTGNSVWVRSPPSAECVSDRRCTFGTAFLDAKLRSRAGRCTSGTHSCVCGAVGLRSRATAVARLEHILGMRRGRVALPRDAALRVWNAFLGMRRGIAQSALGPRCTSGTHFVCDGHHHSCATGIARLERSGVARSSARDAALHVWNAFVAYATRISGCAPRKSRRGGIGRRAGTHSYWQQCAVVGLRSSAARAGIAPLERPTKPFSRVCSRIHVLRTCYAGRAGAHPYHATREATREATSHVHGHFTRAGHPFACAHQILFSSTS